MDVVEDIRIIVPRIDVSRLRRATYSIRYEEMVESWEAVRNGVSFWKTKLGRAYKGERS